MAKPIELSKGKTKIAEKETRKTIENNLIAKFSLECPTSLSKLAKQEWNRLVSEYKQMPAKIITNIDKSTLITYCEAVALYQTAQAVWKKHEKIITPKPTDQNELDKAIKMMNKQAMIIAKLSTDLCLNPVGRAKMGINPADKEIADPLDKLLAKFGE